MNGKSAMTWLIPLAALAVPGFLFYNWWSNLNAQSRKELERKVRSNPGVAAFMGGKADGKLTNPLSSPAPSSAPAAVFPSTAAAAAVDISSPSAGGAVAAADVVSSTAPAAAGAPAVPAGASPEPAKAPGIVITRDPTLSPFDLVQIAQLEIDKQGKRNEVIDAARPRKRKEPKEPPIEDSIDLQGIVEIGSGNKAIINNDMIGEGEMILGKVKILKITPDSVVFSYKNRKFSKAVSR